MKKVSNWIKLRRVVSWAKLPLVATSVGGAALAATWVSVARDTSEQPAPTPNEKLGNSFSPPSDKVSLEQIEKRLVENSDQTQVLIWHQDFDSPWAFIKLDDSNQIGGHLTDLDHQLSLEKIYDVRPSDLTDADSNKYYLASENADQLVYRSVNWFYLNRLEIDDLTMESPLDFDPSSEVGATLISERIALPDGLRLEILDQRWLSQTEEELTYRIGHSSQWSSPRQLILTYRQGRSEALNQWLASLKDHIHRKLLYQDYSRLNFDLTAWLKSVGVDLPAGIKIVNANYDLVSQSLEINLNFHVQSLSRRLEECVLAEQPLAFPAELLSLLKIETQGFVGENFAFKFTAADGSRLWKLIQKYNPSWSLERLTKVGFYHRLKGQKDWRSTQDFLAWINAGWDRFAKLVHQQSQIETRFGQDKVFNGLTKVTDVDWKNHVSPDLYWLSVSRHWSLRKSYDSGDNSTNHLKSLLDHQGEQLGVDAGRFGLKYLVSLSGSRRLTFGAAGARADLLASRKWLTLEELKWVFDGSSEAGNLFDTLNNRAHVGSIEFALVRFDQKEADDDSLKIVVDNWLAKSEKIKKTLDQDLIHEQLVNLRLEGRSRHITGLNNPLDDWAIGKLVQLNFSFDAGKSLPRRFLHQRSAAATKLRALSHGHWNIQLLREIFDGSPNAPNLWLESENRWVFEKLNVNVSLIDDRYTFAGHPTNYDLQIKKIGLVPDQIQFAPKANELFKKLAQVARVEFDPSSPNKTKWSYSEMLAVFIEIYDAFEPANTSRFFRFITIRFRFVNSSTGISELATLIFDRQRDASWMKQELDKIIIPDDPSQYRLLIDVISFDASDNEYTVPADDEDFTVDGKAASIRNNQLDATEAVGLHAFPIALNFNGREKDPAVVKTKIEAHGGVANYGNLPLDFQITPTYGSLPNDLIPGDGKSGKTRWAYTFFQKHNLPPATFYDKEKLFNFIKRWQRPRDNRDSIIGVRAFIDPMPGHYFKNFLPKLDKVRIDDVARGPVGYYEVALDLTEFYRYSDNRASEWWLMKTKHDEIKPDTPYDLNINVSGQMGTANGVRLEFLHSTLTYKSEFEEFGTALQYQVAGREWKWITPKPEGKIHVANITYDPSPGQDGINFRIVPVQDVWWNPKKVLYQDYKLYHSELKVDLHTARRTEQGTQFDSARIYALKNVNQHLKIGVSKPTGDAKLEFTGRTHDAGSGDFSLVSATFGGVDWKEALRQANNNLDIVADEDKDGVTLVISTGVYPNNADYNFVSKNPIYFRIEDFVAYYRGELVADSSGRLTYRSGGKVVTGWEETSRDKLTYLPASEGIKVSSKYSGTALLADMVVRFASTSSSFEVDSTSWIDRDNAWIENVKIYYPTDNLHANLELVGDTHHITAGWDEDTGDLPAGASDTSPVFKWYYAPWNGPNASGSVLNNDADLRSADFELLKQRRSQGLGLTQDELLAFFDGQSRANFWVSAANKWSFMRSLYAWPAVDNARFWSNQDQFKPQQFTVTNLSSKWKRYVFSDVFDLDRIALRGHSNDLTWTSTIGDSIVTDLGNGRFRDTLKLLVALNKGSEITAQQFKEFKFKRPIPGSTAWIEYKNDNLQPFDFLNLFKSSTAGNSGNLWYPEESRWVVPTIEFKVATTDEFTVLSAPNQRAINLEDLSKQGIVLKNIPPEPVFQLVKDSFKDLLDVDKSFHSKLVWDSNKFESLVQKISNHSLKLEISTGSSWVTAVPTETALNYKNRFLKFRIIKGADWTDEMRFKAVNGVSWLDTPEPLTNDEVDLPGLRKVKSLLVVDKGGLNLQNIKFIGNTADFTIDYSGITIPDEIKHLDAIWKTFKVIFRGGATDKEYWVGETKMREMFLEEARSKPGVFPRLVPSLIGWEKDRIYTPPDGPSFQFTFSDLDVYPNKTFHAINTSKFFAYQNIDDFVSELHRIKVHGVVGIENGLAIQVPKQLKTNELVNLGYKLQVSLDNREWKNVVLSEDKIASNSSHGIPEIPAGEGQLITKPSLKGQKNALYFRLAPFKDNTGTTWVSVPSKYEEAIELTRVHPSDYVKNNFTGPTVAEIDLSSQKQLLKVPNDPNQWQISFSGRTNDNFAVQFSVGSQTWQEALQSLNPGLGQDLSEKVKPVLLISYFEAASPNYFIPIDAFVLWLNGQLQTDGEGFLTDPSGNRVYGVNSSNGAVTALRADQASATQKMFPTPSWNYLTWNIQVRWANFDEGYLLADEPRILDIPAEQMVDHIVRYVELNDSFERPKMGGFSARATIRNTANIDRRDLIGRALKEGWIEGLYSFKIDGTPISAQEALRLKLSSSDSDLLTSLGLITKEQFETAFGLLNGKNSANLFNEEEVNWVFNKLYLHVKVSDENRFWIEEKFVGSAVAETLEFDTHRLELMIVFLKPEKIAEKFRLEGHTANIKIASDWQPQTIGGLNYALVRGLRIQQADSNLNDAQKKAMNIDVSETVSSQFNHNLEKYFRLKNNQMQANLWVSQDRKWGFDKVYGGTGNLHWTFYITQGTPTVPWDYSVAFFYNERTVNDSTATFTARGEVPIPKETLDAFPKYVQVNDLVDKLKQIEADTSEASTNEALRWQREADFINPLFDDFRARGVRLDFSDAQVSPAYGFAETGWNYSNYKLPRKLNRESSKRFLWSQIVWGEATGNYIISWPKVIDLTESSKIRLVKTFLDVSEVDLGSIAFKGNIRKPIIDYDVLSDDFQPYLEILFRGEGIFGNKWMTYDELLSAFNEELSRGPNYSLQRVFRAKVVAKSGLNIVFNGTDQAQNVNTDQFYSYRNISGLITALRTQSGSNKLEVFGALGVENGIAIKLPSTLKQDQLSLWKTTLQVSVDNQQNWSDLFPQLDQAIPANPDIGIPAIPAGLGAILTVKQIGGQTPSLAFRFVPYADETGQKPNLSDPNDYQIIVELTKVHNSDYFESDYQKPDVIKIALDNLPTIVVTAQPASGQVVIAGRTNDNFTVALSGEYQSWETWLQSLNQGSNYSSYVKATLHVATSSGRLAFELSNFSEWINGQLTVNTAGQVVDSNGQIVKRWKAPANDPDSFVYGDLTAQEATPNWNQMLGSENVFIFTWLSTDLVNYRPSESRGTEIDMSNVVRYIDASVLEARFAPTGNTRAWSGWTEDTAAVLDQIVWGYHFDDQPSQISEAQMNALGLTEAQKETVRGKTHLTQAELLKLFDGSSAANIWDQRQWKFAVKLYSIATVKDPDNFWTKGSHQEHDLYQASAPNRNWKRFVDVNLIALNQAYLTGNSHRFDKLENIKYTDGSQLPAQALKDLVFKLTLNAGRVVSDQQQKRMNLSAKPAAWMTLSELKDFWQNNGVSARGGANLWYRDENKWATDFFGIGVDLTASPSSFELSDRLDPVVLNLETMGTLKKYIWTEDYQNELKNRVKAVVERHKSDSDQVVWQDIGDLLDKLRQAGLKVEFSTSSSPSFDSASDWAFLNQLPKQIEFEHNQRYLWAKVTPEDYPSDRYVLSNRGKSWDLTASSNVQKVLGRINIANVDLSQVVFTQNTFDAVIDASGVELPHFVALAYLVKDETDNLVGPTNESTFVRWMKANYDQFSRVNIRVQVSPKTTNDDLYVIRQADVNNSIRAPNIDDFYAYRDISSQIQSLGTSAESGVKLYGVVGKQDGVAVVVPEPLMTSNLDRVGIKLQMSIQGSGWQNVNLSATGIPSNKNLGLPNIAAGTGQLITVNQPSDGSQPKISFRFVPFKDDQGQAVPTPTDPSVYQNWLDATMVHLSDYWANRPNLAPYVLELPVELVTLVVTNESGADSNLKTIILANHTRNLQIEELINGQTTSQVLAGLNPNAPDYSADIRVAYHINDNNLFHWLEREDFIAWANGKLQTSGNQVLNGNQVVRGWSIANGAYQPLPVSESRPLWNRIELDSARAAWRSRATDKYTPTDEAETKPDITNLMKWVDVAAYYQKLARLKIEGDTAHLKSEDFAKIIQIDLENELSLQNVRVETTPILVDGQPNFGASQVKVNALPAKINFLYELAFRITPTEGNPGKLVIGTDDQPEQQDSFVIWDHQAALASTRVLKFIEADRSQLATKVVLKGNTRDLEIDQIDPSALKSDLWGQMNNENADYTGLEVVYKLLDVQLGQVPRRFDEFLKYLQTLKFDGSWGRAKIRVGYRALTGYKISSESANMDVQPAVEQVKRYIDVSPLIAEIGKIIVVSQDEQSGWWSAKSGQYDQKVYNGIDWGGYVDNLQLGWSIPDRILNTGDETHELHAKIQFSTLEAPTSADDQWSDQPPSEIGDHGERHVWVRFVAGQPYEDGEMPFVSDSKSRSINQTSRIEAVPTRVNTDGLTAKLSSFEGLTNDPTINEQLEQLTEQHLTFHYSLTNFLDWQEFSTMQSRLTFMGLDSESKINISKLKISMTKQEFLTFNQAANSQVASFKQFVRTYLLVRFVPTSEKYTLSPEQDQATRGEPEIEDLYTYRDISQWTKMLVYGTDTNTSVGLQGRTSADLGIAVSIPVQLTNDTLEPLGFQLQYTTDSDDGANLRQGANWKVVRDQEISAGEKLGVSRDIVHGFWVTLTPLEGGRSYLAMRIVPIANDLGKRISGISPTWVISEYFERTKVKPQDHYEQDAQNAYVIDTSQMPIVINTDHALLNQIDFTGHTRRVTIHEDDNGMEPGGQPLIDALSNLNQTTFEGFVEVVYAIDLKNGQAISNVNQLSDQAIWLNKGDFSAYLNGLLVMVGSKVVYKSNQSQEVSQLSAAGRAEPIYLNLDINRIYIKWSATDPKYLVSDEKAVKLDVVPGLDLARSFRKWFDGERLRQAISRVVVQGHTHNYQLLIDGQNSQSATYPVSQEELNRHGLKLVYSLDQLNFQDDLPDFSQASWSAQVARQLYAKVVPINREGAQTDYENTRLYIGYEDQSHPHQALKTQETDASGSRLFKLMIDVDKDELTKLKILGHSYLISDASGNIENGLDESEVDNGVNKYQYVEIVYRYFGQWYNKEALLEQMAKRRELPKNADLVLPDDFNHENVWAHWRLLDSKDAVLPDGQDQQVQIDTSEFKTFVNIWMIQTDQTPVAELIHGNNEYELNGSVNSANMRWRETGTLEGGQAIAKYNMKVQWSVVQEPSQLLDSDQWQDSLSNRSVIESQMLDPQHKSLWIRFVPVFPDQYYLASQYEIDGSKVAMISINTSQLRYTVQVDPSVLENLVLSGDTQSEFKAEQDAYLDGSESSIKYEKVDQSGQVSEIVDLDERVQWLQEIGLTIAYHVEATRPNQTYPAGQSFTFETLAEFKAALDSQKLNFRRETLRVSWAILDSKRDKFQVSDDALVKPNRAEVLTNVIYTEDITVLNDQSVLVSGNNLKISFKFNDPKLDQAFLAERGVKLEFTTDADPNDADQPAADATWSEQLPTTIPEHLGIWIRFAPLNSDFKLGSDALDGEQITKLSAGELKVAIVLDQSWLETFDLAALVGKTYDPQWESPLPDVPSSEDGQIYGQVQFALVRKKSTASLTWFDTLEEIMPLMEGKDIKALNKDRDSHVAVRYVIKTEYAQSYEFTTEDGSPIQANRLNRSLAIEQLIQPIIVDRPDQRLPNQQTWQEFANNPLFRVEYQAGVSDSYVRIDKIVYDENDLNERGRSFYHLDQNRFDTNDFITRNRLNALAPRHAHFEFSYRFTQGSEWSAWSADDPEQLIKSTTFAGLRIRIRPNEGYELPSPGASGLEGELGDQTWLREFYVALTVDTTGTKFGDAEYVGFNGEGRFKTNDPNHNYNQGYLTIKLLRPDGSELTELVNKPYYVLEYRVTDQSGQDIEWTSLDQNQVSLTKAGWHSYDQAPEANVSSFGRYPISLSNGQIVHARLRARNGYVIIDPGSDDPERAGQRETSPVRWSAEIKFTPVHGLVEAIDLPENYAFYDPTHLIDLEGQNIEQLPGMPTLKFTGSDGEGKVSVVPGDHGLGTLFDAYMMVLEPIAPTGQPVSAYLTNYQRPIFGYTVVNSSGQKQVVYLTEQGKDTLYPDRPVGWQPGFEQIEGAWKLPSATKNLAVGNALLFELRARFGYGFRYQDERLNFPNELFPKQVSRDIYNPGGLLATDGVGQNQTPIPVRGLYLYPDTYPAKEHLVYSDKPEERLNGNAVITMSGPSTANKQWRWNFRIEYQNRNVTIEDQLTIPLDVSNGDRITVQMVPRNPGYIFHPDYQKLNEPVTFVVESLQDRINSDGVPRPEFSFEGYVGEGTIADVTEHEKGGDWLEYDRSDSSSKLPKPQIGPNFDPRGGIEWQFQVTNVDPHQLSTGQIERLPWLSEVPTNLNNGMWVRMRLGAVSPDDVVFAKVYSWGETDQEENQPERLLGWNQVRDLFIDPAKVNIRILIQGFNERSSLVVEADNTLDAQGLIFQASTDGISWHALDYFTDLKNGDKISVRALPRDLYQLNPDDNDPSQGVHVSPVGDNRLALWKDEWINFEVKGLKNYLNVNQVDLGDVSVIRMNAHPSEDGEGNLIPADKILSGWATLTPSSILNRETIKDAQGNVTDATGAPYYNKVAIRYVLRKYDPDTGNYANPVYFVDRLPLRLANNDQIRIELFSKDPEFSLSKEVAKQLTIKDLLVPPPANQNPPQLTFIGSNGAGSVAVTPEAIKGYRWEYAVLRKGEKEPDWDDVTWTSVPPTDLSNGDFVAVRLASNMPGSALSKDFLTGWVVVSGLKQTIDLSGLEVAVFDRFNPYNPAKKIVALRLSDSRENQANVQINAPLISSDASEELVDVHGQPIPYRELLQWKFYVSTSEWPPSLDRFGYALPQKLRNGMYLHITLGARQGLENITVQGFSTVSIKIDFLMPESTISGQLLTTILAVSILGLFAAVATVITLIIRHRKSRLR